jgi:hypothetical protein
VLGVLEEDGGVEMNVLHTHERSAARQWMIEMCELS